VENNQVPNTRRPHSIFFPILLVTLGIFLLLANLGTIPNTAWEIVAIYWPLLFVIGGLDSLYQHNGWVGPLVGIGLGTVLLLGNLHYLQFGSLDLLLRLWPVLLVAWGLDIAFGHNQNVWSTVARVALGLLLVAGILWFSLNSPFGGKVKTVAFNQNLDGATQSELDYSVSAGRFSLSGGADEDTLSTATLMLPDQLNLLPSYTFPVEGVSQYSIEGNQVVLFPFNSDMPWEIKVNTQIPLDLTTRMGAGNMVDDLSDVNVDKINTSVGAGRIVLTLPEGKSFNGRVQMACGEVVIRVPKGTHVVLHLDTGAVSRQLSAGFTDSGNTIENEASGDTTVELNVDIAVGSLVLQQIP
jgi:hypothetical protein